MITNFKNRPGESLLNGYVRFRELLDNCPHHELPPWFVLHTFYGGLSSENRDALDFASGRVFMKSTLEEAWKLLDDKIRNEESWEANLGSEGRNKTDYDCVNKFLENRGFRNFN